MAATVGDPPKGDALFGPASAAAKRKRRLPSGHEAPWLFSLRSFHSSGPDWAVAVRISPKNDGPPEVVFDEEIPEKFRNHYLIASVGNYIFVENSRDRDGIHLVDPFSSWTLLHNFPARIPRSRILNHFDKVATDGRSIAVAIAGLIPSCLVYTTSGLSNPHWIVRDKMTSWGTFTDVVYHNADGLFYALSTRSHKVVALKFVSSSQIRGNDNDLDIQDMTLELGPGFDPLDEKNHGWCCFQFGNLVHSPSNLYIVRWRMLLKRGEPKRREVDVYKLSADKKMWVSVDSLDDNSFFLGFNQSLAASTDDFPELRRNLIYIPYDASLRIDIGPIDVEDYIDVDDYMDEVCYNLIYDVKSKSWEQWDRRFGMEDMDCEGVVWPAVWMMPPRLKKKGEANEDDVE